MINIKKPSIEQKKPKKKQVTKRYVHSIIYIKFKHS